jgi:hypothetical protein
MECFAIPVIIGATGIVTEGLKSVYKVSGNHSVDCLQKAAVLGTLHIVRKVLRSET